MTRLKFEDVGDKDKDIWRLSFVIHAFDGTKHFPCYVPYHHIDDYHKLSGKQNEREYSFKSNLDFWKECCQRAYDNHGLESDGCLIVRYEDTE